MNSFTTSGNLAIQAGAPKVADFPGYTATIYQHTETMASTLGELEDRLWAALDHAPQAASGAGGPAQPAPPPRPSLSGANERLVLLNDRLRGILNRINL